MNANAIPLVKLGGLRSSSRMPWSNLELGEIAILARKRGEWIECGSGSIWVTFEKDTEDHVLSPRERIRIPNGGKAIVGGRGSFRIDGGFRIAS